MPKQRPNKQRVHVVLDLDTIARLNATKDALGIPWGKQIGRAIQEKAQRDGLDKSATDEEINGEE